MSLRIRTVISGVHKYLDLFDDENILMSFSVGEIQDITSKNSGYSKSFTLPGTKNNNDIFNYYYDVNSVPLDFDPNDKFDAIISWDGYEILVGNIRLDGVSIEGEDFTYQATFYNQVGNLSANIGDKFLRQTDLSHLSHPFTEQVILQSNVDYNLFPITGTTNYSYQNGKTMWGLYNIGYSYSGNSPFIQPEITPLVEFSDLSGTTYTPKRGHFDFTGTPVNDYYFKPTLQIKELYTSIVRDAGYEIQSNFFNTSYFERFYLPLKFLDETVYSRNATRPCYTYVNPGFFFSPTPTSASTNPILNVECNTLNLSANTEFLNFPTIFAGAYTFKFSYTLQRNVFNSCGFTIVNTGPGDLYYEYVNSSGVVTVGFIPSADVGLPYNIIGEFNGIVSGNGSVTNETSATVSLFSKVNSSTQVLKEDGLCNNQTSTTQVEFTKDFTFTGNSNIQFYFVGSSSTISNFKFEIFNGPRFLVSGQTFDYSLEFPDNDYKQIDFITSINRYFNLVVVPSPDKPSTLIIEPIVDYFGKGEVLDWTTKVDYNQLQSLSPTTSLINGTLDFEFKLDQDYANQDFNSASNKVFGTDKINLNIPYKNANTKFTYIFSSPIDITINAVTSNYLTLSSFSKIKNADVSGTTLQQFQPFKILPRVVFRGLTLPSLNYGFIGTGTTELQTWYMRSFGTTYPQTRFTNINRFTTYPFNYSGFSHYINFRGEDLTTIQPREFEFVAEDLYDIYYKDYIEDLISPENKIYKVKIYLTPNEVKSLLYDEKILIKNSLFRINKIDNFNLLEPSICDLELVKLTKTYDEHRVLYYDLIPCGGGATKYSNSDFNYNLYAYIGNYVTLYDDNVNALGCHQVVQGSYNSSNNYQHYYISSGFTSNFVNAYSDCNCTGFTAFDVVQDGSVVPPVPSATPTQTPTSTQVPSPTPTTTQTPTPTTTQTPTVTQTPTSTQVPSPTPTSTQTPTVTQTPTNTETPTPTMTPTQTLTNTPTQTLTNTPTPSATPQPIAFSGQGFNGITLALSKVSGSNKLYIGGQFTQYPSGTTLNRLVRVNEDGTPDTSFNIGSGFNSDINSITEDTSNGKVYVGGNFTTFTGTSINRFVRLNSDGSRDTTFNIGTGFAGGRVFDSKVQSDGKVLVFGFFTSYTGATNNGIIRLNTDGSQDTTFSAGTGFSPTTAQVTNGIIDSNGKIVCVGQFTGYNGTSVNRIIRLNTDGSIDNTFSAGTGFNAFTYGGIHELSNGQYMVFGDFTSYSGVSINRGAIRLNSNGSRDTSYVPSVINNAILGSTIDSQNRAYLIGAFNTVSGVSRNFMTRLTSGGTLDTSYVIGTGLNTSQSSPYPKILVENSGSILFAGTFVSYSGQTGVNRILRTDTNGNSLRTNT